MESKTNKNNYNHTQRNYKKANTRNNNKKGYDDMIYNVYVQYVSGTHIFNKIKYSCFDVQIALKEMNKLVKNGYVAFINSDVVEWEEEVVDYITED